MHTTETGDGEESIRVHHNSDWSGEIYLDTSPRATVETLYDLNSQPECIRITIDGNEFLKLCKQIVGNLEAA